MKPNLKEIFNRKISGIKRGKIGMAEVGIVSDAILIRALTLRGLPFVESALLSTIAIGAVTGIYKGVEALIDKTAQKFSS